MLSDITLCVVMLIIKVQSVNMLSAVTLSVIMLNDIILVAIVLSVAMLHVRVPFVYLPYLFKTLEIIICVNPSLDRYQTALHIASYFLHIAQVLKSNIKMPWIVSKVKHFFSFSIQEVSFTQSIFTQKH
jgi:hypothetical protein